MSETSTSDGKVLLRAEFNPGVKSYWLLSGTLIFLVTIVGIPLIPFYLLIGFFFTGKYLAAMECELTDRSLRVKKGLLNRIEKTVPLDKITDLAHFQGPIMRKMDLEGLKLETAGQSSGPGGALVSLVGVKEARAFRDRVLAQRDLVTGGGAPARAAAAERGEDSPVLIEIRDALLRIEAELKEKA